MSAGTKVVPQALSLHAQNFFHLRNYLDAGDEEGAELANLAAARMVALHNARFSAGQIIKASGRIVLDDRIEIADADGNVLDTVSFRDAMTVEDSL